MSPGLLLGIGVVVLVVVGYLVHDWRSDRRLRAELAEGRTPPRGVAGEHAADVHAYDAMPRPDDGRSGPGF
ncbi:hypothetical protein [Nocardioides sp. AX2bis]|uniref:hypothetical protein n=1 Tax=Nocardioides sp. AX2bis TaxID=2653157 RepID=UPI0012EF3CFE|nr:hypothetical protein [Nocardioides sp. AX2bis]VXC57853.1 hypothetical protein NOCARDAX2BIS_90082 [Nocardioides sp. AX2bis]